jgi:hypothetical protein
MRQGTRWFTGSGLCIEALWEVFGNLSLVEWLCDKLGVHPWGSGVMPPFLRFGIGIVVLGVGLWLLNRARKWTSCRLEVGKACIDASPQTRWLSVRITLRGSYDFSGSWQLLAARFRFQVLPASPESPLRCEYLALPPARLFGRDNKGDLVLEWRWRLRRSEWKFLKDRAGQQANLTDAIFQTNHGTVIGSHTGTAVVIGQLGDWPDA